MVLRYRRLGTSGLQVSELSFGSWLTFAKQIDEDTAGSLMKLAYDSGINFFDNAEIYARGESELTMGRILRKMVWTMHQLIMQGKVMYWGTSEWGANEIREAHRIAVEHHLIGPVMEQPQYNLFHREKVEREFAPLYATVGLGTTIWSPLASGVLTGKHSLEGDASSRLRMAGLDWLRERELTEARMRKVKDVKVIADDLGLSLPVFAIAWCLKNPHVSTVILGASKEVQLKENLTAVEAQDKLTPEVMERIESVLDGSPA
ncbi:MAG TPA: aldo/keto reductase [Flavobacteriales bacterium]|nr:aldo/keto reductase [Flavobacteriales bacterium]